MSERRQGLRALGVSLLALLGLMAFVAGGAEATKGAKWLILGSKLETTKEVAVEKHSATALLVIGGTFNITIHCTTVKSEDVLIFGKGSATGKLALSGCTTTQLEKPLPKCDPIEQPIVAGGKALLISHKLNKEGEPEPGALTYILFEPTTGLGGTFATIKFGTECSLTPSKNLTGTFVAECGHLNEGAFVQLDCKNEEASHLLRQAPAALFESDALLFGAKPEWLEGILKGFMTSEPSEKWSGTSPCG